MSRCPLLPLAACCLLVVATLTNLSSAVDIPSSVVPRHFAPDWNATAVINQTFQRIALSDYQTKRQWVVLLF